jgi:hypothetical protein
MHQEAQVEAGHGQLERLGHLPRVRLGAVVALALAAAFIVWLVVRDEGHPAAASSASSQSVSNNPMPQAGGTGPVAASVQGLKNFATAVGHPVYWAGPQAGSTYELTQTTNGRVFVRYLPSGVAVGVNKPFLTIATYPYPHAFASLSALAKHQGGAIKLGRGGIALVDKAYPKSVHLAYPGLDYEIEVFSPSPRHSREVVLSAKVASIG